MGRCNSDGSDLHELIGMAPVRDEARAEPRDDARDVRKSDSESGDDERSSLWITEPLFEVREVREADDSLAFQPELARQISERASELASELLAQASASFYVSLGEALAQATEDGTLEAAVARARAAFEAETEGGDDDALEGDDAPVRSRCALTPGPAALRVSAPPARERWASGAENGPTRCQRPVRAIVLRRLPDAGPN